VLSEKGRATILLRDRDPAASLARDLPLGCLQDPPGARCLACRAIMLFELAKRPAQRRSLPTSTANTAGCNAGVVEGPLGLLPASRATPHHSCRLYPAREKVARSGVSIHYDRRRRRGPSMTMTPTKVGLGVVGPTAPLIRPGYVAWVGDATDTGLRDALTTWFGSR
jgi:hypothetical protein